MCSCTTYIPRNYAVVTLTLTVITIPDRTLWEAVFEHGCTWSSAHFHTLKGGVERKPIALNRQSLHSWPIEAPIHFMVYWLCSISVWWHFTWCVIFLWCTLLHNGRPVTRWAACCKSCSSSAVLIPGECHCCSPPLLLRRLALSGVVLCTAVGES